MWWTGRGGVQAGEGVCPGPVFGQVQDFAALRPGETGGDTDEVAAQGRASGCGVKDAGEGSGGAQQVVADRGADGPGGVGVEMPRVRFPRFSGGF